MYYVIRTATDVCRRKQNVCKLFLLISLSLSISIYLSIYLSIYIFIYLSLSGRTDHAAGRSHLHRHAQGRGRGQAEASFSLPAAALHLLVRLVLPAAGGGLHQHGDGGNGGGLPVHLSSQGVVLALSSVVLQTDVLYFQLASPTLLPSTA